MRMQGSPFEAHVEAGRASLTPLRSPFESLDPCEPVVGVVIGIGEGDSVILGEADVLHLPQFVFLARMDVRIVEKDLQL